MTSQFSNFLDSLDTDPARRGRQFERFVKWFLKADPEWSTQVEEVWLLNEWPDRWGADCGTGKRAGIEIVILLAGGDKSTQAKDIRKALKLAREM